MHGCCQPKCGHFVGFVPNSDKTFTTLYKNSKINFRQIKTFKNSHTLWPHHMSHQSNVNLEKYRFNFIANKITKSQRSEEFQSFVVFKVSNIIHKCARIQLITIGVRWAFCIYVNRAHIKFRVSVNEIDQVQSTISQ